jgi:hypothetical protein
MLSNILLSRLSPYTDEIIGDHQCEVRHNRSTTDHIFCIHQILEKKWEYNETVHQLFTDFNKAYDSVRREVVYNISIVFVVCIKLERLILRPWCLYLQRLPVFNPECEGSMLLHNVPAFKTSAYNTDSEC